MNPTYPVKFMFMQMKAYIVKVYFIYQIKIYCLRTIKMSFHWIEELQ